MRTLAHVTHEAIHKVGGIGAVLQGLLTSPSYQQKIERTILIGPLFLTDIPGAKRLGPDGEVIYSSVDGVAHSPVSEALERVRRDYHVGIVYGHRTYTDPHSGAVVSPEVLLIDVSRMDIRRINNFKSKLWDAYGLDSLRYEHSWEYDLYVKLAEPALAALHALGAADYNDECVILAHEFMGLPTALAARLDPSGAFRTVFYAHEVATMRRVVEDHPGHDITFYNVLSSAIQQQRYVADVFGSQDHYYRHALVKRSHFCDKIFAVGDYVAKELLFMGPEFAKADIDITYNGIPAEQITLEARQESQERLRDYAETLLGDRPDYIFTHVTRTALSKGMWRDLRVLENLERPLRRMNKTAVLFVLSTEVPPRRPQDVREMEKFWHWPVAHREGDPDLSHGEAMFYQGVQYFNTRGRNIKVIFVNQFGFERNICGEKMSPEMQFLDIRRGSDVEFGQSIYEPFGIAQLEPLTFGAICVLTRVCGCAGFVDNVTEGEQTPNVLIVDYTELPEQRSESELLSLTRAEREQYEDRIAEQIAQRLLRMLPKSPEDTERLLKKGYELASQMSWEIIASQLILPGIDAICRRYQNIKIA